MAHFPVDDLNPGWIKGWGVVRMDGPWHLFGVFPSRTEADVFRAALGPTYRVGYGARRLGSDDFMFDGRDDVAAIPPTPTRWERGADYLMLEGVSSEKGKALVVDTSLHLPDLPVEFRPMHLLSDQQSCMAMYHAARSWAAKNGFEGVVDTP